jgi:predicted DNA-binding transcriptional regulator YafY
MLKVLTSPFVHAATRIENEADTEGWRVAIMPVGSIQEACVSLLGFGAEADVLEPPELRARMAEVAAAMNAIYGR